ncbi:hypothetical protein E4U42_002697 [Claviceps africana]|uniref:Threonylcarbamoyl-AMP synthase n=1 Tax=Claviceps africana TaxID=83212 RepID=A0A8K0J7V5_9HYPO|nr:hypothetical protein E4U42_002697 [Claviceps africana]
METRVVPIPRGPSLGYFDDEKRSLDRLDHWHIRPEARDVVEALQPAADHLRTKDSPVAFPTETVYGLGADATRSGAVRGIYSAKGRPSDNPLIVHVCDLHMLRTLLGAQNGDDDDQVVIPDLYRPLMDRFWPGPLTILLPKPDPSPLAPEVTAGLATFGVRMPSSPLALTLIQLARVPLAAPSANASTKPSPTTAQHVKHDLDGRIEWILDGGPCAVGVESTVVDGLCRPPAILRPGGIAMDDIRACPGWEGVVKAYQDQSEEGRAAPRAPGMKYKHYSPRARVVLYEAAYAAAKGGIVTADAHTALASSPLTGGHDAQGTPTTTTATTTATTTTGGPGSIKFTVGVIRTKRWPAAAGLQCANLRRLSGPVDDQRGGDGGGAAVYEVYAGHLTDQEGNIVGEVFDIGLGQDVHGIAQGLFSALRELDGRGVDVIFVEGVEDDVDIAAAVMNRLRKAASDIRS